MAAVDPDDAAALRALLVGEPGPITVEEPLFGRRSALPRVARRPPRDARRAARRGAGRSA